MAHDAMESPLRLAPAARPVLSAFGEERQPLLTVDAALPDPAAVIAVAARHAYRPIGPFYPGVRAAVSAAIAMPLVAPLLNTLQQAFALDRTPAYRECYLSVVTTAPADLAPIQRLPHFDGTGRERIAVLLYLDRAERGGTAFYRQRTTGYESVDEARYESYRATLAEETARHGLPDGGYIAGDTAMFLQTSRSQGASTG